MARSSPSLFGARIVSVEDASFPAVINVQNADAGNPYTNAFTPWLDTSGVGLDLEGVDVAANGHLAALGYEAYSGGTQTVGSSRVLAIQGLDQAPAFPAAVDCQLPAAGIARDASLAQDASAMAWEDTRLQPQSLVKRPRRQILSFAARGTRSTGSRLGSRWWWGPVPLGPCRAKHSIPR